jgi:hypothetical protein
MGWLQKLCKAELLQSVVAGKMVNVSALAFDQTAGHMFQQHAELSTDP